MGGTDVMQSDPPIMSASAGAPLVGEEDDEEFEVRLLPRGSNPQRRGLHRLPLPSLAGPPVGAAPCIPFEREDVWLGESVRCVGARVRHTVVVTSARKRVYDDDRHHRLTMTDVRGDTHCAHGGEQVWNDGDTEEDFLENTPAASYTEELLDNEMDFSFNLAELVAGAGMQEQVRMVGPGAMDTFFVSGIADDSRKVQDGDLFVCMKGAKHDGHKYAMEAFATGCAVVVVGEEALAAVRTDPHSFTYSLARFASVFAVRLLLGSLLSVGRTSERPLGHRCVRRRVSSQLGGSRVVSCVLDDASPSSDELTI